jgi:tetratricopeptide (TPR) repeat protein
VVARGVSENQNDPKFKLGHYPREVTVRILIPLVCAAWLIALSQCWAGEQEGRFLELQNNNRTTTYDLSTVQVIQPGRFSITGTTIDEPYMINLELKLLGALRPYCDRPAGKYLFPVGLLTFDPPDMPVKSIEVQGVQSKKSKKIVLWEHPYKWYTNLHPFFLSCEKQDLLEQEQLIKNGSRMKELFDCRRGLSGSFYDAIDNGDPSKVSTYVVLPDSGFEIHYLRVCYAVMHEWPYMPERPASAQVELGNTFDWFKEYAEAAKWYRLAADQGLADAQYKLGSMYDSGGRLKRDYPEAAKWYRLAANQGDGDGQLSLGIMYYWGNGVPQDYVQAYKWFTLALARFPASSGNALTEMQHNNCVEWRDKVAEAMTTAQIAEAKRQVAEWRSTSSGK